MKIFEAGQEVSEGEKSKKDLPMILVTVPHDEEKPNTTGWEKNYPNFKFRSDFLIEPLWLSLHNQQLFSFHFWKKGIPCLFSYSFTTFLY